MASHAKYWVDIGRGKDEFNQLQVVLIQAFAKDPWLVSMCKDKEDVQDCLSKTISREYEKYIVGGKGDFAVVKTLKDGKEVIVGGACLTYALEPTSTHNKLRNEEDVTILEKRKDIVERVAVEPMKNIANRHNRDLWYGYRQAITPELQGKGIGSELLRKTTYVFLEHGMVKRNLSNPPLMIGMCTSDRRLQFVEKVAGCLHVGEVEILIGNGTMKLHVTILPIDGETTNSEVVIETRKLFVK